MQRLISVFACLIAASAPLLVSCSKSSGESARKNRDEPVTVTVATVESLPMDRKIPVVGTLFPKDDATVAAEVEGKVEKTMAEFGDRLAAGQEIAQIDTTLYEALARLAAANLARAQSAAANMEQNLKRIQLLHKDKISSISDLDKAVAEAEQARAEVKAAEAAEAIARLNLARSHVKAPFESAVADRIASAGDFMKVGTPLFRVVNDGVLKLIVGAAEKYAGQVKKEQVVLFKVDAWPDETFEGRVYLISPSVNTANRAFAFGALVQNPDRRLKASSFASGDLILERDVPTLVVPLEAIVSFAGVTKIFVITNGVARSREVEAGRVLGGRQEILRGVRGGEVVAVTGQTKLYDGAKARVRESDPARTVKPPREHTSQRGGASDRREDIKEGTQESPKGPWNS